MIETIIPQDEKEWLELRTKDITSTEVGALFGISPYCTAFELWHRKKGNIHVDFAANERMAWGNALQDAIAAHIAKEQGWQVRRMTEYIRKPDLRIGASFDFSIEGEPLGLLEIKNVDGLVFKNEWQVDGPIVEGPLHIEIQVQHQLAVSGRPFAYIGVLVGGNKLYLIKREPDPRVIDAIEKRVAEFWASIDAGIEPKPDFQADCETIAALYGYAEPGKVMYADDDTELLNLAAEYKALGNVIKESETRRDELKAKMLFKIGDAEKVIGEGFSISAGVQGPAWIEAYERKGFRMFRINWKKQK